MKTPVRLSLEEFTVQYEHFFRFNCRDRVTHIECSKCLTRIAVLPVSLQIHNAHAAGCAGTGHPWKVSIPYCPRCEKAPELSGCLHLPVTH